MSWSSRRAILVLTVVATLGGIAAISHVYGQAKRAERPPVIGGKPVPGVPGAVPGKKETYDLGSLALPMNEDLKEKIESATDKIKKKEWAGACDTLQQLIGRSEDVFVPVTRKSPDGTESIAYVSVKQEAARIVATMPKDGRAMYETKFGEKATKMVKDARTNNDFGQMAQAMSLYLYTEAGIDAATWLGTYTLDRAEFQGASRFFAQLVQRDGIKELKDKTLIKAAYAFHQAGDTPNKALAFKELERRSLELKLGEKSLTSADLQDAINKTLAKVSLQSASDSPVYRGRPNRSAMLPGGTPFLEPSWRHKTVLSDQTSTYLKQAETALQSRNQPLFSSFVPVTATMTRGEKKTPLLLYRSYKGIHVVNMKDGSEVWAQPSELSYDTIIGAPTAERTTLGPKIRAYTTWLDSWLQSNVRPQTFFENSVLSTLSADNQRVYAVEDMPIAPPQSMTLYDPRGIGAGYNWGEEVSKAIVHNRLMAFDLNKDGKLAWEIGGTGDEVKAFKDTYFMSAPLPINGRLYVLTEKQQELRLVALDPTSGKSLGAQTLATTKDLKMSQDPLRRMQAAHLSYGEGILVVPTNAGAVFGVDLMSNSLLWAYPYRDAGAGESAPPVPRYGTPPPGWIRLPDGRIVKMGSNETYWQVTAPAVANGRVVFTAPDAKAVHCVNLRDGSQMWTHSRAQDDLFMAGVFNNRVIIVGKKKTRALSLSKGEILWEVETGMPSGQGAASAPNSAGDIIYYLPIREAVNTREPEICAINVDKGIIHAHTRSRKKEVPGNLIFYEGNVLSQTHTEVVAYPQLEIKLAELDKLVKEKPDDPTNLTERGDYLLDKGDLGGAIADFRRALANKPAVAVKAKARTKLFEAFTEYFQRDFGKAEEYIKEYEEMCKIDLTDLTGAERSAAELEMRRRRANFLCLVGKGREAQNRLVDAFERYLELGTEAKKDELIQVVDEPSVKAAPDVWSQGRIASMVANAKDPKQKKALEDQITARWNKIKVSKPLPLEDLRKFVSLFGSLFGVGKDARLALAERLMDDTDINSLLEAEQQLSLLRGDESEDVAARAVEALARLNLAKGRLEDAAHYYKLLGEKYPKVTVDGKTGQDYLDDLATDKRFLPYLDGATRFVIKGKVSLEAKEERKYHSASPLYYQFSHAGETLPFFNRHKLSLEMNWNHQLRLVDTSSNEERWKIRLTPTQFQQIAYANNMGHRVKFNYQSLGHLVVLQLGHMVFGIDPLGKGRVLWERSLSSLPGGGTPSYSSLSVDQKDNSVVLLYPDGWMQRLGQAGPLQGSVICLQMRDSLTAIDPVSGRVLWTRTDVNSRSQMFGDENYVYVVGQADDGSSSGTRVFRAYDGVSVKVRDFSAVYNNRTRIAGRTILSTEKDAKGTLTMRLYDVLDGKDVWRETFAAGTLPLNTEDSRLAGVAEPDGTIRVIDVPTRKEILKTKLLDKSHLDKAQAVQLVTDPDYFFIAINGPADPNIPAWGGGVQQNVKADAGLRSVPVNGMVYSWTRKDNKFQWYSPVENQQLILSQADEMPLLLFTSRYQHMGPPPFRNTMWKYATRAIAKHNGKMWYAARTFEGGGTFSKDNNEPCDATNFATGYFHGLALDHRSGKVEFTAEQTKITLTATPK